MRSGEEGGREVREAKVLISGDKTALLDSCPSLSSPCACVCHADVPPSYSHYYSNPSYHTLSQCSPNPPPPNKVSAGGGGALWREAHRPASLESPVLASCSPSALFPLRFQARSLPACRPLSGQVGPKGMITTPPCLLTGSTAGSPLQGLWTGVGAGRPGSLVRVDVCGPDAASECVCLETGAVGPSSRGSVSRGRGQRADYQLPPPPQGTAAWTEATAIATAMAQAHSTIKVWAQGQQGRWLSWG